MSSEEKDKKVIDLIGEINFTNEQIERRNINISRMQREIIEFEKRLQVQEDNLELMKEGDKE